MVAYNFMKQFAPRILDGSKPHTIRADRKRHARPGEPVQLYVGLRTRHCRLLAAPICEAVLPIVIELDARIVMIEARVITGAGDLDAFAFSDGFDDWNGMETFWRKHHPGVIVFRGVLIQWEPVQRSDAFLPDGLRGGADGSLRGGC